MFCSRHEYAIHSAHRGPCGGGDFEFIAHSQLVAGWLMDGCGSHPSMSNKTCLRDGRISRARTHCVCTDRVDFERMRRHDNWLLRADLPMRKNEHFGLLLSSSLCCCTVLRATKYLITIRSNPKNIDRNWQAAMACNSTFTAPGCYTPTAAIEVVSESAHLRLLSTPF